MVREVSLLATAADIEVVSEAADGAQALESASPSAALWARDHRSDPAQHS